jgi:hypothetical protein
MYCKPAPRYTKVTGNKHAYVCMYSHNAREKRRERNYVKVCIARKRNVKYVIVECSACKVISYECKMPGKMCKGKSERKVKSYKCRRPGKMYVKVIGCKMPGRMCKGINGRTVKSYTCRMPGNMYVKVSVCKKKYPMYRWKCCFGPMVNKYVLMVCTNERTGCTGKNDTYSYYGKDGSTAVGMYSCPLYMGRYGNSLRASYAKKGKYGSTDIECISVPSKMSATARGEDDVEMEDPLPGDKGACRFSISTRVLKLLICLLIEKKSSLNNKKSCRAVISFDCNSYVRCQINTQLCKTVYTCPDWNRYITILSSTISPVNYYATWHCVLYVMLGLICISMPSINKTVSVEHRFIIWCSRYGE